MSEFSVYERELSAVLDCPVGLRRELLGRTECMVEDFRAGKPDASWDEVHDFLGDPRELAEIMLESVDRGLLARYRKRKRFWKLLAVGATTMLIVVMIGLLFFMQYNLRMPVTVEYTMNDCVLEELS